MDGVGEMRCKDEERGRGTEREGLVMRNGSVLGWGARGVVTRGEVG